MNQTKSEILTQPYSLEIPAGVIPEGMYRAVLSGVFHAERYRRKRQGMQASYFDLCLHLKVQNPGGQVVKLQWKCAEHGARFNDAPKKRKVFKVNVSHRTETDGDQGMAFLSGIEPKPLTESAPGGAFRTEGAERGRR